MSLHIIIMAAGQGKRMHSNTPKVLHLLAGKPLLSHVIDTALCLHPTQIHVIVGHGAEQVKQTLSHYPVHWVQQPESLGTGHAVLQALPFLPDDATVMILSGDVPLIQEHTLQALLHQTQSTTPHPLTLLLAQMPNPKGLGRILRDPSGQCYRIVEEKDATHEECLIQEIYSGICCVASAYLKRWLPQLSNNNQQKEYYLTDILAMAVDDNVPRVTLHVDDPIDIQGVNQRSQLHQLERAWQARYAQKLMDQGVSLADAQRIDVRGELVCERDVWIDVNNVFIGSNHLGEGCHIGPNSLFTNVTIGKNCTILANSVLEDCVIGDNGQIGPFARLRPGTHLASDCKIGNFVETKKATFGVGSKASHLSYLGDVTIGDHVNIGAGTITCNYDGQQKFKTIIEDHVFIGSGTQLVAPITIGEAAVIGAGTTLRKSAPAGELTLTESIQKTVYGWKKKQTQT